MLIRSNTSMRMVSVLLALAITTLAGASCNTSQSSLTAPTPPPAPAPLPAPPPPPAATGSLSVSIRPNPVPFSGQPITDAAGCSGVANTWFYEQVITETGGANVTIVERVDLFDGRQVNKTNVSIDVPARGATTLRSRWCSASAAAHTAQTNFTARDAGGRTFSVDGPTVNMMRK